MYTSKVGKMSLRPLTVLTNLALKRSGSYSLPCSNWKFCASTASSYRHRRCNFHQSVHSRISFPSKSDLIPLQASQNLCMSKGSFGVYDRPPTNQQNVSQSVTEFLILAGLNQLPYKQASELYEKILTGCGW